MKKLFLAVVALMTLNWSIGQTHHGTKTAHTKADSAQTAPKSSSGVVLKKDGTPDKRYKQPSGPLKKDGTPDKRFKQNKAK